LHCLMKNREMKHTVKNIRGKKIVIQCKTQEEADALLTIVDHVHSYNYTSTISTEWAKAGEETCYHLFELGTLGVGMHCKDYWVNKGYEVVQFPDVVAAEEFTEIKIIGYMHELRIANENYDRALNNMNEAKIARKKILRQLAELGADQFDAIERN